MSSGSDNEEFYDASDTTPIRPRCLNEDLVQKKIPVIGSQNELHFEQRLVVPKQSDLCLMPPPKLPQIKSDTKLDISKKMDDSTSSCSESLLNQLGQEEDTPAPRTRLRRRPDRRHKSPEEDDDGVTFPPSSPGESQSSSVDAIFPATKTSAPFRVVEVDETSVYSTTFSQDKGNKSSQSSIRSEVKEEVPVEVITEPLSPEPDVVASTKTNSLPRTGVPISLEITAPLENQTNESQSQLLRAINRELSVSPEVSSPSTKEDLPPSKVFALSSAKDESTSKVFVLPHPPVAPPRSRKKRLKQRDDDDTISTSSVASLPVPGMSLFSKTGSDAVGNSLDIQSAVRGEFIVRPQDTDSCKALGPSDYARIESDTTSQASTPETSRNVPKRMELPIAVGVSSSNTPSTVTNKPSLLKESISSSTFSIEAENRPSQTAAAKAPPETGKDLTDEEILAQVSVLNLDTGERIPLSEADECLPSALNPLSLHILKLTNEYLSGGDHEEESDEESIAEPSERKIPEIDAVSVKKKTNQIKKFLGRKVESAVSKAKILAQEVSRSNKEEKDVFEDDAPAQNVMQYVKIKTSHSHKGPIEFDNLMYVQELKGEHTGPVWCMKFSPCGRLLATAGQDHVLRVWVLKQAFNYFLDIRTKWNADVKASPTPSQESLVSQQSSHSSEDIGTLDPNDDGLAPFMPKPFCTYTGHSADVLDLSWSNNYFMLTSSMDKTVRLWHISRKECLCIFKHVDFVTAIAFHPKDDRYFISGSLDGKLRLWSIPDKQVVMWNEVEGHPKLITAANFCQNGAFTVVGTYNGRCIFYKTDELKYYTQIHVKSSRGKNARGGRKITGIEPLVDENKLMITSNDSRIRLYNLGVLNVCCKYKGCSNLSSQIKAGFSHDGKYIVCGSENQCIYIWKTNHDYSKFSSARKDRNIYWEGVKAHSAVVTCAIFSPRPDHVFSFIEQQESKEKSQPKEKSNKGYVLVSADFNGCIKIFLKKEKPKHSSLPASAIA